VVVVDPGHGGRDPGAVCGKVYEKDINLQVALALKKILERSGATVVLTREGDHSPAGAGASVRRDLENRAGAPRRNSAHIFLSLHTNSFSGEAPGGPEVFYHPGSAGGRLLAQCIQEELLTIPGVGERSARANRCLVLSDTAFPSALVELGFLSNRQERERLLDNGYRAMLAEKIKDGVLKYYSRR
jgi:N-acetylmuramoyl-L-alanine amidase